jgi:hypothetical protein
LVAEWLNKGNPPGLEEVPALLEVLGEVGQQLGEVPQVQQQQPLQVDLQAQEAVQSFEAACLEDVLPLQKTQALQ